MDEYKRTTTPTCTGTSVFATVYDGGVAICSDRKVSMYKMSRFRGVTRQYQLNKYCVVAFSGDFADFQWLQNILQQEEMRLRLTNPKFFMTPKAVHSYLSDLLYYRRSQLNPIWTQLLVGGMQPIDNDFTNMEPYIGVITPKGVSYKAKSVATGMGAMLLNQLLETDVRAKNYQLSEAEAKKLLTKLIELSIYHDCEADNCFDISTIDTANGVKRDNPMKILGNWDLATYNNDYQ
uniref:Proteasome subunit beta n=1 Tax=Strongyloides venezuelensis TaxID=75913 RepID=A0A0K0EZF9_STRVS